MAKKVAQVKREIESGFNFSKFYFSKPTSVALVTTYVTILVLVLSTLGLSKIIASKPDDDGKIPSLPETEAFAFLPADSIDVPELGDVKTEQQKEAPAKGEVKAEQSSTSQATTYSTPAPAATPVVVEVPKEVTKTVEKEVVKTVEVPKEVVREVEVNKEPEQTYIENYYAPDNSPIGSTPIYINYPDIEEPTAQEESTPTEAQDTEETSSPTQNSQEDAPASTQGAE